MKKIFLFILLCGCTTISENRVYKYYEYQIDKMPFMAEIPVGSDSKYEFRKVSGSLILDRKICPRKVNGKNKTIKTFPASYGIAPGLFNIDGDPLDLLVIGNEKFYQRYEGDKNVPISYVRPIGIVKMEECNHVPCDEWEQDWKVLAVDVNDQKFRKVNDIKDLSSQRKEKISDFFSNYKGNYIRNGKEYPKTRVAGFLGKSEASKFIKSFILKSNKEDQNNKINFCTDYFNKILTKIKNNALGNVSDSNFVMCSDNVWSYNILGEQIKNKAYMQYSAKQILEYKLKIKIGMKNSLSVLQKRRENGEKSYRFVAYDVPRPGTKNPIFEWVKVLNRNEGCSSDFPAQHYEK